MFTPIILCVIGAIIAVVITVAVCMYHIKKNPNVFLIASSVVAIAITFIVIFPAYI